MIRKNIFINVSITSIVSLGILALVLLYHPTPTNDAHNPQLPDAIMEDVVTTLFDKEGKPQLKIVTPKMVHFADGDVTDLTTPLVTVYRKSPQPWRVSSLYAKAINGTDRVDFWDNVIIQHSADQNAPTTLIKTPKLTVHPDAQTAETNDAITVIQPNIVVKSIGMFANMDSGDIKLLSEAKGEYVPDKF